MASTLVSEYVFTCIHSELEYCIKIQYSIAALPHTTTETNLRAIPHVPRARPPLLAAAGSTPNGSVRGTARFFVILADASGLEWLGEAGDMLGLGRSWSVGAVVSVGLRRCVAVSRGSGVITTYDPPPSAISG